MSLPIVNLSLKLPSFSTRPYFTLLGDTPATMELRVLSQLRHITLYYDHPGGTEVDENVLRFSGAALSRHKLALEHPRPLQGDPDLPSYPFRFGLVSQISIRVIGLGWLRRWEETRIHFIDLP